MDERTLNSAMNIIMYAGDADLSKHVFLFNLSFDLILINFIVQMIKNSGKEVD